MRTLKYLTLLLMIVAVTGCDSLVDDAQDPIDSAGTADLTEAEDIPFLVNGVQARFSNVYDNASVQASLLSDQFIFGGGIGGGATFPTFARLDQGVPRLDNNSVDATQGFLGQYRFLADDLVARVAEVDELGPDEGGFADGNEDPQRINALFTGHFHGGVARYFYATYFGLNPREGGGIISTPETPADPERGEFTPSPQMYQLALDKLNEAEAFATEYQQRVINSLRARIHLFQNDLDAAQSAAENGLVPGDAPFQAQYVDRSSNQQNGWFSDGGPGRTQLVSALRFFYTYLAEDPAEAARIPVFNAQDAVEVDGEELTLYAQALYVSRDEPIDFLTWQENELMLAEIEQRQDDGDPLSRVNAVRASHELSPLDEVDLDAIFVERDKELFTQGLRLPDQRRAQENGLAVDAGTHYWHLGPDTWWYLPITLDERNRNPNID